MPGESYYVIFFDDDYNIKKAHKSKKYPTVGEIVSLLKLLEVSELTNVEKLKMDIITEEQYRKL